MNNMDDRMNSPDKAWSYVTSGAAVSKVSQKGDSTGAVRLRRQRTADQRNGFNSTAICDTVFK